MIKPPPIQVKCVKCHATTIISPSSDAIAVPRCKKCGGEMVAVGAVSLIESVIKSLFRKK